MLIAWLTARGFLGLAKGFWLLGIAFAVVAAVGWFLAREEADDEANRDIGAAIQREGDLRQTIERVEEGNATREETRRVVDAGASAELHALCLRTARTPENCRRFLPERPAD